MKMEDGKRLHGNRAKAAPDRDMTGLYITNAVTMSDRADGETPLVDDENVKLARDFSQENKK